MPSCTQWCGDTQWPCHCSELSMCFQLSMSLLRIRRRGKGTRGASSAGVYVWAIACHKATVHAHCPDIQRRLPSTPCVPRAASSAKSHFSWCPVSGLFSGSFSSLQKRVFKSALGAGLCAACRKAVFWNVSWSEEQTSSGLLSGHGKWRLAPSLPTLHFQSTPSSPRFWWIWGREEALIVHCICRKSDDPTFFCWCGFMCVVI